MGNTTLTAFDPDPLALGLVKTFKAASAILRGAVVAYATTGLDLSVAPATSSLANAIGVALTSQATVGGEVSVAMNGSVVKVMLDQDDGTLDAGHWVSCSGQAGCVTEWDPAVGTHAATIGAGLFPIGFSIDDISAGSAGTGGTGYIVINVTPRYTLSS
jgi:hypothetical protein